MSKPAATASNLTRSERDGQGNRRHNPKSDAARAQAATNGSPHPRVLNPGPLPLGPGIETRHTHRSRKAADVPRFWLGRSAARRLLGLATTAKAGKDAPPPNNKTDGACGTVTNEHSGKVSNQNEQRESQVQPADLVLADGEVFSVR